EKPCRALFCHSAQRSFSRLLNISFFCRCCAQRHSKTRKSTQEARARFGWTPTNARIQTSEAVRILNGQRSLADAAHALHCRAAHRCLRNSSGLVLHQDGVERSLADAAHALHCRAAHRCLRNSSGLVLPQDGVELVQFLSATCEACDTRRHSDERSRRRWCCLRLALSSGNDATFAFLRVLDAREVLIDVVG